MGKILFQGTKTFKALETKNTNLKKKANEKNFSRARKNLMAGIRGNLAIKKSGGGFADLLPGKKKPRSNQKPVARRKRALD